MTDIEQKALALVNELQSEDGAKKYSHHYYFEALCRAIEQHEAFKQEVSDALVDSWYHNASGKLLERFIISKPDPLREIAEAWGLHKTVAKSWVEDLRAALEARGLEIRSKNDE
jgi:hypothetical protein